MGLWHRDADENSAHIIAKQLALSQFFHGMMEDTHFCYSLPQKAMIPACKLEQSYRWVGLVNTNGSYSSATMTKASTLSEILCFTDLFKAKESHLKNAQDFDQPSTQGSWESGCENSSCSIALLLCEFIVL